jgi:tetratricopeptide (TPR) repeat protein
VDPRQHLKALQAHVASARAAFDAGDRDAALQHLDHALSIDPSFLAAQSLRERVLAKPRETVAMPAAPELPATPATPPAPATLAAPRLSGTRASRDAYERMERRAKQRRIDHCIASTRAALGRQQPDAAAAALDELIALDPDESNVPSLSAELADLRRRSTRRPFGVRLAAASAFLAVAGAASWLEHPRRPAPALLVTTASVQAMPPAVPPVLESRSTLSALEGIDTSTFTFERIDRENKSGTLEPPVLAPPTPPPPSVVASPGAAPPVVRAASTGTTAPLSLPVPLSQLPPVATTTAPREPPAAATITAAASVAAPAPARAPSDRELVEEALQSYRRAYGRLNVQSAQAVYPSVNRVALARAFDNLESQLLTFDSCDVELRETFARAICHGTASYTPKIGNRYPRAEALVWSFELRKHDGDWTIEYAKASR